MTDAELRAVRVRWLHATKGPYRAGDEGEIVTTAPIGTRRFVGRAISKIDAVFLAGSWADVGALLSLVEDQREEIAKLREEAARV